MDESVFRVGVQILAEYSCLAHQTLAFRENLVSNQTTFWGSSELTNRYVGLEQLVGGPGGRVGSNDVV